MHLINDDQNMYLMLDWYIVFLKINLKNFVNNALFKQISKMRKESS